MGPNRHFLRYSFTSIASLPLLQHECVTCNKPSAAWSRTQTRFLRSEFHRKQTVKMNRFSEGWQNFDNYNVYAWSLSGIETCVVLKSDDLKIAFDMGYSIPQSISCANVFISHGHMDHIGGVTNHASKRGLYGMRKARYFVPPHLVENLMAVTKANCAMAETTDALEDVNILPFGLDETVSLPNNYYMRAFPTVHRIPSQGYILYKQTKKLKQQYVGQSSAAIAELHRDNVPIHDIIATAEVAFTGDTMIEVFLNPPNPDLLRVKLLIVEATFIDHSEKADNIQKAREFGHIHLQEISDNAHLFRDVKYILLIHFSTKYSAEYIQQFVSTSIAPELLGKVYCATIAKEKTS